MIDLNFSKVFTGMKHRNYYLRDEKIKPKADHKTLIDILNCRDAASRLYSGLLKTYKEPIMWNNMYVV